MWDKKKVVWVDRPSRYCVDRQTLEGLGMEWDEKEKKFIITTKNYEKSNRVCSILKVNGISHKWNFLKD